MLNEQERIKTVDYIVAKIVEKGKNTENGGQTKRYEEYLPYCSIGILIDKADEDRKDNQYSNPVIEIAENFGNPNFQPSMVDDKIFRGLRTLYRAERDKLQSVLLQGFYELDSNGKASMPKESIRRGKDLSMPNIPNIPKLTTQDLDTFDRLIIYTQRELKDIYGQ